MMLWGVQWQPADTKSGRRPCCSTALIAKLRLVASCSSAHNTAQAGTEYDGLSEHQGCHRAAELQRRAKLRPPKCLFCLAGAGGLGAYRCSAVGYLAGARSMFDAWPQSEHAWGVTGAVAWAADALRAHALLMKWWV